MKGWRHAEPVGIRLAPLICLVEVICIATKFAVSKQGHSGRCMGFFFVFAETGSLNIFNGELHLREPYIG